ELFSVADSLKDDIRIVFVPDYNMELAKKFVAGVDLWLNTPLRPFEASGTSGMKATFNGVPNLSILDGWWIEGCIEGVTGWAIGNDAEESRESDARDLYNKLEQVVLPLYYQDRKGWIKVMKGAISKNASYFNSNRMMRRYAAEAYIR
ncbi:MAG: glycogen/starch/alpha-glucan phosphorylase, partial [Thioalkalispiraceae bacterium]